MSGNKLRKDQVQNLPEDLTSLESEIESTDSVNDSVDASLNAKIDMTDLVNDQVDSSLQSQIDLLKTVIVSLIYPRDIYIYQSGPDIFIGMSTQFAIPTNISYEWSWTDDIESDTYIPIEEGTESYYRPENGMAFGYKVDITFTSSLGVLAISSNVLIYTPAGK